MTFLHLFPSFVLCFLAPPPLMLLCVLHHLLHFPAAREEAGLKIGTDRLPILFVASLLCTCLASPAASALIAARRPGQGQQIVLHGFAILLAGACTRAA
jgi:hypothetical protein